jgi:hypothetical protein
MKKLLATVAVLASVASAQALGNEPAVIPEDIRGTWCHVGVVDNHGGKVMVFRRGQCKDGSIVHTYTAYGRFGKFGKSATECRIDAVETTERIGWIFSWTCGDIQLEQFVYPMTKGRLGLMTTGIGESK